MGIWINEKWPKELYSGDTNVISVYAGDRRIWDRGNGLTVTPPQASNTEPAPATSRIDMTMVLTNKPIHDVAVSVRGDGSRYVSISNNSFTFTPDNWDTPQAFQVIFASVEAGHVRSKMFYPTLTSDDASYNNLPVPAFAAVDAAHVPELWPITSTYGLEYDVTFPVTFSVRKRLRYRPPFNITARIRTEEQHNAGSGGRFITWTSARFNSTQTIGSAIFTGFNQIRNYYIAFVKENNSFDDPFHILNQEVVYAKSLGRPPDPDPDAPDIFITDLRVDSQSGNTYVFNAHITLSGVEDFTRRWTITPSSIIASQSSRSGRPWTVELTPLNVGDEDRPFTVQLRVTASNAPTATAELHLVQRAPSGHPPGPVRNPSGHWTFANYEHKGESQWAVSGTSLSWDPPLMGESPILYEVYYFLRDNWILHITTHSTRLSTTRADRYWRVVPRNNYGTGPTSPTIDVYTPDPS